MTDITVTDKQSYWMISCSVISLLQKKFVNIA